VFVLFNIEKYPHHYHDGKEERENVLNSYAVVPLAVKDLPTSVNTFGPMKASAVLYSLY